MATKSITQDTILDNLPPHLQAAIDAGRTIEPQVNGRYTAAVNLVVTGAVSRNPAGGFDVMSRSTGIPYHINGASCTCKDAEYNAPIIAGRKACAHQVAAWIVAKAELLASQATSANPAESQPEPTPAPMVSAVEPVETAETAGVPLATLLAAAAKAQGVAYELVQTHIGGHGYVNILQAAREDPSTKETYLVDGDWDADRLHVCRWGKTFGQPDWQTTARLQKVARAKMAPAVAYYLEASENRIKVMVTRGEQFPKVIKTFSGSDRLDQAREFSRTRAEAQLQGLRNASPHAQFEMAISPLPDAWRQRMGGWQVGRGWVISAEVIEQPAMEVAA